MDPDNDPGAHFVGILLVIGMLCCVAVLTGPQPDDAQSAALQASPVLGP